jgi:hypothetical protein
MAKKEVQRSHRDDNPSAETEEPEETEEPDSSDSDEDFWSQWQLTSIEDVKRDTYGSERRRDLEHRLRA